MSKRRQCRNAAQLETRPRESGLEGIRTPNLLFRRQTLYPLSYEPKALSPPDGGATTLSV